MTLSGITLLLPPVWEFVNALSPSCVANSMNCTSSAILLPAGVFLVIAGIGAYFGSSKKNLTSRQMREKKSNTKEASLQALSTQTTDAFLHQL